MIVGKIKDIEMYKGLSKNLDLAIDEIVKGNYKVNPVLGRNEVAGDDVFFSYQELEATKDYEEGLYETHKKYIDIQIPIEGIENYGVLLEDKELTPLDEFDYEKDFCLFKEKEISTIFTLTPEDFIIFFPGEPHMPCLKVGEKTPLRKVVYKIAK